MTPFTTRLRMAGICAALLLAACASSGMGGATAGGTDPGASVPATEAAHDMPQGRWEGELATPRRPLVVFVDFDSLHARFSTTGRTTFPLHDLRAEGAGLDFAVHAGRDTIPVQVRTETGVLRGYAILGGDRHALSLTRLADLPVPRTREEAWLQDMTVMLTRFLRLDRSFTPTARATFEQRLASLRDSVALLSAEEITVRLARAVALSDNAHTRLYLVRNRTEVRRMPFRVWEFAGEHRVVRAADDVHDLLGCRLTHVEETEVADAARRLRDIKAGNDSWQRYMTSYMLTAAEILRGEGLAGNADAVTYRFDCGGRSQTRTVRPLPLTRSGETVEAWWDLSPASTRPTQPPHSAVERLHQPLYLRQPDVHYWFEQLPESGILYFQYNRAQNTPGGKSLREFAPELIAATDNPAIRALVVDLRFNTGGDLGLATPLMRSLQEKFAGRPVFVITGRATFSAGITHLVQWKEWGARIVGEPAGDELDTWSEGGNILLPNSRLTVHYTNGFHSYSRAARPELEPYFIDLNVDTIAPDVPIDLRWSDYTAGRDPAMLAIEAALGGR